MWCLNFHKLTNTRGIKALVPISRKLRATAACYEVDKAPLPFSAMPGPKPLPLLGNSLELKKNLENLRLYYREGFNKFGDIYRIKGIGMYYYITIYAIIHSSHNAALRRLVSLPQPFTRAWCNVVYTILS